MLRDLDLRRTYRSNEDDLLNDFYVPCLGASKRYARAVGYFSSSALSLAADGLSDFIRDGGTMRLVFSPHLHGADAQTILDGYEDRAALLEETVTMPLVQDATTNQFRDRLGVLGWLIAKRRLDIRIAITTGAEGPGIYHEKVGMFRDRNGDRVAFHGSANESRGGFVVNFESIMVFRSWQPSEVADVDRFAEQFEGLWSNETPGLEVLPFPAAARRALIEIASDPTGAPPPRPTQPPRIPPRPSEELAVPAGIELRPYQEEALSKWFAAGGTGLLEMATGSGKTITALTGAARLGNLAREQEAGLLVLILCPYQHLVTQWADEARRFGAQPLLCYRSRTLWETSLTAALRALRGRGAKVPQVVIATYATFQSAAFQAAISNPALTLLIADEAHNAGAPGLREALPDDTKYRLGLSATPERHFDHEGTAELKRYFGDVVFSFTLEDAMRAGALVPYSYRASIVDLDEEELERYVDLTRRIGRAMGIGGSDLSDGPAKYLLIARARLIANAHGKLGALASALGPLRDTTHNLIYCGDGSRESDTGIEATRQIEDVVRLVGRELGMRTHPYTSETPLDLREELRQRFADGDLQALVAIRCLDEGVDIPATERAFILASSTNPRQFIQRRGRVLRPAPGKTRALIHDFLAVPPVDALDGGLWEVEKRLVTRELERAVSFAELASNSAEALNDLEPLRSRYGLHHI